MKIKTGEANFTSGKEYEAVRVERPIFDTVTEYIVKNDKGETVKLLSAQVTEKIIEKKTP